MNLVILALSMDDKIQLIFTEMALIYEYISLSFYSNCSCIIWSVDNSVYGLNKFVLSQRIQDNLQGKSSYCLWFGLRDEPLIVCYAIVWMKP